LAGIDSGLRRWVYEDGKALPELMPLHDGGGIGIARALKRCQADGNVNKSWIKTSAFEKKHSQSALI